MKEKLYKCRESAPGCNGTFKKRSSFQVTCDNPLCAIKKATRDREKKEAKARGEKKRAYLKKAVELMSVRDREKRVRENIVQPYIRERDFAWYASMGKEPACCMCGNTNPTAWHAAHFVSVGSRAELQFHPANINLSCLQCNFYKNQADTDYRPFMIARWGIEQVEFLESFRSNRQWEVDEIEEIGELFKEMRKGD